MPGHNTVHIAGRGLVVRQLRIIVSQFRVLRTGTLPEIRPDNKGCREAERRQIYRSACCK